MAQQPGQLHQQAIVPYISNHATQLDQQWDESHLPIRTPLHTSWMKHHPVAPRCSANRWTGEVKPGTNPGGSRRALDGQCLTAGLSPSLMYRSLPAHTQSMPAWWPLLVCKTRRCCGCCVSPCTAADSKQR